MSDLIPSLPDIQVEQVVFDWERGQATITYVIPGDQHEHVGDIKTKVIDMSPPELMEPLSEAVEAVVAYLDAALVHARNPATKIPIRR